MENSNDNIENENLSNEKDEKIKKAATIAGAVVGGVAFAPVIVVGATAAAAKKIPDGIRGAKNLAKKARLKKYNPLFLEEYESEEYNLPNLIGIVDDENYKGIDVCEGAMGVRTSEGDVNCLLLFDEEIATSKLNFVPFPTCGAFYYVDPHNRNNFIEINELFDKTREEKLAELANVAYCLGAKYYSIEIVENEMESSSVNQKAKATAKVKVATSSTSEEHASESKSARSNHSFREGKLSGNNNPIEPELVWFKDNSNINSLVSQVCSDKNSIVSTEIVLSGAKYAVMSQSDAAKVDATLKKIGGGTAFSFSAKSKKECNSKIHFKIEFPEK